MKIVNINNSSQKSVFKAGKVRVFSDFDKTFLPASHKDFTKNASGEFITKLSKYFNDFKDFLEKTHQGLKFSITTGRTFGEFYLMAETARQKGIRMPLPDSLIVKNGSDEHIKVGMDSVFYDGGEFPFRYDVTNKNKENDIKKLTGWEGGKVKEIFNSVYKIHRLKMVEADTEHSKKDYGVHSLFHPKNRLLDDRSIVGVRKDGNLKYFAAFPDGLNGNNEYDTILKELSDKFHKNGINYTVIQERIQNNRIYTAFEPKANISGRLTKAYDTKEALKQAIKSEDLVIAAGDGSNDLEMLNPAMYLYEIIEDKDLKLSLKDKLNKPKEFICLLNENPKLAEIYRKMPFIGILVKSKKYNNLEFFKPFCEGEYKKLTVIEEGQLETGIKQAIKLYCRQNPDYAKKLSSDIKSNLEPLDEPNNNENNNSPKTSVWKYILIGGSIVLAGLGIYYWSKPENHTK